jgi:hypothetical protein
MLPSDGRERHGMPGSSGHESFKRQMTMSAKRMIAGTSTFHGRREDQWFSDHSPGVQDRQLPNAKRVDRVQVATARWVH